MSDETPARAVHEVVESPNNPRPDDPLLRAIADALRRIEVNYGREGSGPGSRFEGELLEDVQARRAMAMMRAQTQTIDATAAAFAKVRGSFDLHFDADQNYIRSDDCPWTLILDGQTDGWGGVTAEEAIEFAAAEIACNEPTTVAGTPSDGDVPA